MNPTAFAPPGHQQMPYGGAGFDPSIPRPNSSFPYPQQPQYPHQQQPYPPQAGFPRGQPQYFQQQQASHPGNLQSPAPTGRPGPLNQPGAFQGLEGQTFSAPPYSQPMSANALTSSMPQSLQSHFPGSTGVSQQSTPAMAAPPQLASQNMVMTPQKPSMPSGPFGGPPPPTQTPAQTQAAAAQGLMPPLSPKSASREKLRVSLLLEINSSLLQEIISLQAQGKAGLPGQPSPTHEGSPDLSGSPGDPSKSASTGVKQQPSQECADCMRRLQANLSYLAAVADRHKRTAATFPQSPAIMTPPPHLQSVRDLYKKLNAVFPGALKALAQQNQMAMAQAHAQAQAHAHAQMGAGTPMQPHTVGL